jgi:hypothetical protein
MKVLRFTVPVRYHSLSQIFSQCCGSYSYLWVCLGRNSKINTGHNFAAPDLIRKNYTTSCMLHNRVSHFEKIFEF